MPACRRRSAYERSRRLPPSRRGRSGGILARPAPRPGRRPRRRRRRRLPRASALAVRVRQPRHARPAARRHPVRRAGRGCARQVRDAVDGLAARLRVGDAACAALGDLEEGRRDRRLDRRRAGVRARGRRGGAGRHPARRVQRRLGVELAAVRVRRREPARVRGSRRRRGRHGWRRGATSSSSRPSARRRGPSGGSRG